MSTEAGTPLRIATRQSKLALWQAEHVAARLRAAHPDLEVVLVPMTTQGDRVLDRALAQVGGKGLFVKELEVALASNRADIAVHSMKDVPGELPDGMMLCAFLDRADPRDAFVSRRYISFDSLPHGARVGTSSPRRQCQLKALRPDIETLLLRGNVETRLRKLAEGEFDAIVLASAGLNRLGLAEHITELLDTERSIPAVGQGIVGIECRSADTRSRELTAVLNDRTAELCITAERAFARRLEGSCQSPIAGFAELSGSLLTLRGMVGSMAGDQMFRGRVAGPAETSASLGLNLAERLLNDGAEKLLEEMRAEAIS
ncbi:MAG: hydroxymethylbilane synthase [Steroidobacteraceae bacterium]